MSKRLEGKVAIVTGGGRGIGKAICEAYAAEGAVVLVSDIVGDTAVAVARAIETRGGRAQAIQADVSKSADCNAMVERAYDAFGRLDILVNNAGIAQIIGFLDIQQEDWDRILGVNLTGAFYCSQHAIRRMQAAKTGGCIINIASISGQFGSVGRGVYGITKAGLAVMTKILAAEFSDQGIRVNAIAPGPIQTEMTQDGYAARTVEVYKSLTPMRRFGLPKEVAGAAVFLASEESSYVCGHVLNVDGGFAAAGILEASEAASS
jgi:3-oxoacyl-[acyl-carrier protein] reductase